MKQVLVGGNTGSANKAGVLPQPSRPGPSGWTALWIRFWPPCANR